MPNAADGPKNFSDVGGRPIARQYAVSPRSGDAMSADLRRRKQEAEEHEKDVQFLKGHPNPLAAFDSIREARLHHEREQERRRRALSTSQAK